MISVVNCPGCDTYLHPMLALEQPALPFAVQKPLGDFWKEMGKLFFLYPVIVAESLPWCKNTCILCQLSLSLWFSSCANLTQTSPLGSGSLK